MIFFLYAALMVGYLAWHFYRRQTVNDVWGEAEQRLGLLASEPNLFSSARQMSGQFRGTHVRVATVTETRGESSRTLTRYAVAAQGLHPSISFEPQKRGFLTPKDFTGHDLQVGEREFDAEVDVAGARSQVLSLLDQRTRDAVRRFLATSSGARIANGWIETTVDGAPDSVGAIETQLLLMIDLRSQVTKRSGRVLEGLLDNASTDPSPDVRLGNLQCAIAGWAASPEVDVVVQKALSDADPRIRLLAATTAERAGDVLLALIKDGRVPIETRVEALEWRLRRESEEAVAEIVAVAARARSELAIPAIRHLGQSQYGDPVRTLIEVAAEAEPAVAVEICRALAHHGDPRAEDALVGYVEREGDDALRTEAAKALEVVGTIRAVEPLLLIAKALFANGDLKTAARDAVRSIQARLGAVEAGRVSLTEEAGGEGAVSIAETPGGLSVVEARSKNPVK